VNPPVKLALFAVGLVLCFGVSYLFGSTLPRL
jgi:hypothetical protein